MLKGPLGDPHLRLAFWHDDRGAWGGDSDFVPEPFSGRVLTSIERDGRPAVAIVHDLELAADPELIHAAGAVALLAEENAQLEAAWNDSLRELRDSRARIAAAGEIERRALAWSAAAPPRRRRLNCSHLRLRCSPDVSLLLTAIDP
jgi:hypothetical protein